MIRSMFAVPNLLIFWLIAAAIAVVACGPQAAPSQRDGVSPSGSQGGRQKTVVLGISNDVKVMPMLGSNTTAGGWQSVNELYAQGLVTSDRDVRRPVPRLAAER